MALRSIGSQTETENFQTEDKGPQNVINDLNKTEESEHYADNSYDENETTEDISNPEVQEVTLFRLNCHNDNQASSSDDESEQDI
ncbi:hypothetical protein ACF0H5_021634 [Mactra antiquata]